jgi:hypothetical protein
MLSGSWVFGVLTFLISILIYERISVYEEEFLRKEFGIAHTKWAEQVPFLLPRLHGWIKPKYKFWVRRSIRREDRKIYWLITAVVLFDFARRGFDVSQLSENLTCYYIWAWATVAEIIIRFLLHFTKTFDGIS